MASIAVYSSHPESQTNTINNLKRFFKSTYNDLDFLVFSDDIPPGSLVDTSILSSFYMGFYKGKTVFLNVEDYLEYKDKLLNNDIVLLLDIESALENKLDPSVLKNTQILSYSQDKMELMPKHAI